MEAALDESQLTDSDFATKGSVFPNEFVSPATKELRSYGLQYAKAMYFSTGRLGGANLFWNDTEYQTLMELAQGRQSVADLRKMFGYFTERGDDAADDGSAQLSYLNLQVLNLAPKYINRAVQKIINRQYSVQLEAIDPVSVHEKQTYENNLKVYYELREWMSSMNLNPRDWFPDLDVDLLPEFPDEIMYEMLTNPKIKKSIDGELSLTLLQEMNDFNQKMRMFAWDEVVFGRGHIEVYRDENGVPRMRKINPKFFIGAYVEDENFKDQEYAGYLDFPTVNEFRKEASESLSQEEIEAVVSKYAYMNNMGNTFNPMLDAQKFDGLNYIPVMRFYYLSQDDRVFITRRNFAGNKTIMERGLKWTPKDDTNAEEVIKNSYTSVYGGVWVLDTDVVYNYGRKPCPRSNLVDATLPIITFAPNYKDGRTVSFLSQMIEPLFMINVAWNKIKEVLAKGWMGYQEIDFTQLEAVALGKGGKTWSPRQVYQHFLQTGRLIKRSPINKHDQRYSASAVDGNPSGLQMADYFSAFTTGINMLEQMTGTTAAESVDQPDRMAVRVMQQSQETGDLDMGYLFNAYEYAYRSVSHQLLMMLQEAKRDGVGISGFIASMGQHFSVPDSLPYTDYGLFLVQAPTRQEWLDFYASLTLGLQSGAITHLDDAFIREVKNLKKARLILGYRIKINERKNKQAIADNNQAALEANQAAAAAKTQGDLAVIQAKGQMEIEVKKVQGLIDEALLDKEHGYNLQVAQEANNTKKIVAKQTSTDEIVKQAVRNKGENENTLLKSATEKRKEATKK